MACGDLLLDVEVPENFDCSYSFTGSLWAESDQGDFELSVLRFKPKVPSPDAGFRLVLSDGGAPAPTRADVSLHRDDATTTRAGFGNQLIVTTHTPTLGDVVAGILASLGPAHDPFGPGSERVQSSVLRPSHGAWFAQRRESLLGAIGWHAELPDAAARLDAFWAGLVDAPPSDKHHLETMISCVAVGFGDLLRPFGFEWRIVCDEWGTGLGMVALPGTADVLVVPDSFVGKRWEDRVRTFVEDVLPSLQAHVEKAKAAWLH